MSKQKNIWSDKFDEEELKQMTVSQLIDNNVCPTCFDRAHDGCIYGNNKEQTVVYQDEDFECFFVGNPRSVGHMIISTMKHYHDMREAPDELNDKIFRFAKELMNILVEVYGCERVYLCTMCDGLNNHYHVQLIPRYPTEERGSNNFVKPRQSYVFDEKRFNLVKQKILEYASKIIH